MNADSATECHRSHHHPATAPTSPVAGTRWHDTTLDVLKIRDKANTAWITQAGSVVTNNSVDINAGTIDGAVIGGTTPAAGSFTNLDATNMDSTIIGATTPEAGNFTTVDATGNITVGGTVDGRDVAADGVTLDAIEASADLTPTGVTAPYIGTTAPAKWVIAQGGTIGNGSSGGTARANADTEDLFTLLWDSMADAQAPVSTGRGASAAADFAANKTITLPNMQGKMAVGTGGTAPATHGDNGGAESVTLTQAETPVKAHSHTGTWYLTAGGISVGPQWFSNGASSGSRTVPGNGGDATADAHNNMPPWVALNYIIKL